jgi:hypothetical protein
MALDPASSSKDVTDKDALLLLLHILVLVDLHKYLSSRLCYPYLALVDLRATYNFISQSIVDKL